MRGSGPGVGSGRGCPLPARPTIGTMRAVSQKGRCRDWRGFCAYFTGPLRPCHRCAVTAQSYTIGIDQRQPPQWRTVAHPWFTVVFGVKCLIPKGVGESPSVSLCDAPSDSGSDWRGSSERTTPPVSYAQVGNSHSCGNHRFGRTSGHFRPVVRLISALISVLISDMESMQQDIGPLSASCSGWSKSGP